MTIFYISTSFFVLILIFFLGYCLYSKKFCKENSLHVNKKDFTKIMVEKLSNKKVKIVIFNFFAPRMGKNKTYFYNRYDPMGKGRFRKHSVDSENSISIRVSRFLSKSKSIWNITKSIEEAIGSTYVFTKKNRIIWLFDILTFLLATYGFTWPIMLGLNLNYSIKSIINSSYNHNILITSLLVISSILSGYLSILIRQIYVWKTFLRISKDLKFTKKEIHDIKKMAYVPTLAIVLYNIVVLIRGNIWKINFQ